MRKISSLQIFVFLSNLSGIIFSSGLLAHLISASLPVGAYQSLLAFFLFICFSQIFALLAYRTFLKLIPINEGVIEHNSKEEWVYHIHLMFYLIFFHPVIRSELLPIFVMRVFYQALGAKMGENSFSSGMILDGFFVEVGDNTLIGQGSILTPHAIENDRLAHYPIRIGGNVTVGANSTILPGVTIEDGAIVSAGALVKKGTHILKGEVWGGVPARKISSQDDIKEVA